MFLHLRNLAVPYGLNSVISDCFSLNLFLLLRNLKCHSTRGVGRKSSISWLISMWENRGGYSASDWWTGLRQSYDPLTPRKDSSP